MLHRARFACASLLVAALAGCGGGGDDAGAAGGGFATPGTEFSPLAAWQALLTGTRSWSVSGIDNFGRTVSVTIAVAPGANSLFPLTGASTARSDATLTTRTSGATLTTLQQTFFQPATLQIVGLANTFNGETTCDVAVAAAAPPSAARIPGSGALATLDERDGCLATSRSLGTIEVTWSLEAEGGIAYFCIGSTESRSGSVVSFEQDCVQTLPDGSLGPAARVTLQQGGVTVVAR